jgi:hypothetical protein
MSHLEDTPVDAGSTGGPDTAEARSRRLHEEFEVYYAERERRRLTAEALARRMASWCTHGRVPSSIS